MVGKIPAGPAIDDIGTDIESETPQHRERAKYLRQMIETTPTRPDRDRLEQLADQYEQLADRAQPRCR
jgi:AAA+ superfamily predicted ATPase